MHHLHNGLLNAGQRLQVFPLRLPNGESGRPCKRQSPDLELSTLDPPVLHEEADGRNPRSFPRLPRLEVDWAEADTPASALVSGDVVNFFGVVAVTAHLSHGTS